MALDAVNGLCYLHAQDIRHQDINSRNVFVSITFVVKIGDFGLAEPMPGRTQAAGENTVFSKSDEGKMVSIQGDGVKIGTVFLSEDEGEDIEIRYGQLILGGVARDVAWSKSMYSSCCAKIVSVDPQFKGKVEVLLADGRKNEFENCEVRWVTWDGAKHHDCTGKIKTVTKVMKGRVQL